MTTHVVHDCPKMSGLDWGKTLSWASSKIPLAKRRHENCPYCGAPTKDMESASADMIALLNRGSPGRRNMQGAIGPDTQVSALREEIRRLSEIVAKQLGGGKK